MPHFLPVPRTLTSAAHFLESSDGAYHVALTMGIDNGFPPNFDFKVGIYKGNGADGKALELVHSRTLAHFNYTERKNVLDPAKRYAHMCTACWCGSRYGRRRTVLLLRACRYAYMHSVAQTDSHLVVLVGRNRMSYERVVAKVNDELTPHLNFIHTIYS